MKTTIPLALACCLVIQTPSRGASTSTPRSNKAQEAIGTLLTKGDFAAIQKQLASPLLAAGIGGLNRADVQAGLARYEFIRSCGADTLSELAKRDGGAAFLRAFFSDASWIESLLISDPPKESYAQAAENLRLLSRHGKGLDVPLYRRLATAMALSAGKLTPYLLVERFGQTQRAHQEGLLHISFESLDTREMRHAIYLGGNAADYEYLLNDRQTPLRDYLGACWAVAYRGDNDYGDSIQGPWYHHAFRHGYPGWEAARMVGGVCGSLSTYGSLAAKVHGVMSNTVGQPGHCAYVVRLGEEWPVGNSVTWPTATSSPGWEGTGYATLHRLYEPVSQDVPRLLAANRATWLARLQIEEKQAESDWMASYEVGVSAQPLNYDVWLEYAKALPTAAKLPSTKRLDLARRAATTFAGYPEAAWGIVQRLLDKSLAEQPVEERANILLGIHREVSEDKAIRYEDWPFEGVLDWQSGQLGKDPQVQLAYFSNLLKVHAASSAPQQRVFSRVLGWGQKRFADNPKTSAQFAHAMAAFFQDGGNPTKPNMIRDQIINGLRTSSSANDLVSYRLWVDMSAKLLPAVQAGDIHLNEQQRAAFPAIPPFPGQLLSEKGLLKTSSVGQYDKPLAHPGVLRGDGFGGYFDTNAEDSPSAIVQLPGDAELTGIAIANRYEFPSELDWAVPFEVSISADGKTWSEIATFDRAQPSYRVDLTGKDVKARFVKVMRLSGKKERFHLRNILVFGKPLY